MIRLAVLHEADFLRDEPRLVNLQMSGLKA
jgi:hypothetical protein